MAHPSWREWAASGEWLTQIGRALPLTPGLLGDALAIGLEADVALPRLMRLVSSEQVLAARVVRMANVAAFAPMHEVTSIDRAVVRLGTRAIQRAVLSACFVSWAQPNNVYGDRGRTLVWHGIGTAGLGRRIALRVGSDPDEAFAHGLLHDIGKLFLLKLHTEFIRSGGAPPAHDELAEVIAEYHPEVGGLAMQHWGLSDSMREPVRWHHQPMLAPTHPRAAAVTYAANILSHRYGFGCDAVRTDDLCADPVCVGLGLTPEMLDDLDRESLLHAEASSQALH